MSENEFKEGDSVLLVDSEHNILWGINGKRGVIWSKPSDWDQSVDVFILGNGHFKLYPKKDFVLYLTETKKQTVDCSCSGWQLLHIGCKCKSK